MDNKIQNLAWSILPKEFKEEVKKIYYTPKLHSEQYTMLQRLFGDNLTSDIEGEEILMVSRKKVQEIYSNNCVEIHRACISSSDKDCYRTVNEVLKTLYGSKCLLDDITLSKPKHSIEFKLGDVVRFKYSDNCYSNPQEIKDIRINKGDTEYQIGTIWAKECFIELYIAPKFKIGDNVYDNYDHPNVISIITKVFSNSWGYTYCLDNQSGRIHENHLRPAQPKEKIVINTDNFSKEALTKALINLENASLTLRKALNNFHG